jgi:hypothetical protein
MKTCITCGMPLEGDHAGDIGLETEDGLICRFDVKGGAMKSPEEIFDGGVLFFLDSVADGDRAMAERITCKNMSMLPYWQNHSFDLLNGPKATDEEFGIAMAKL